MELPMKVNIFDLKYDKKFINKFSSLSKEILSSGLVSEGKFTKQFEMEFAKFVNCQYASCVTSGTSALEIALKAINVENCEVIIPSNTFFATATAVRSAGGKLQLVDMEDETFAIDPRALWRTISMRTKAVVLVHIGGIISKNIEEIKDICKHYNIYLIEDAAHAHGSKRGELSAGSIGDIGCFSFFPTKVMTTGEGGMITTNNKELFDKCISLRNFGRDPNNIGLCINDFGNNCKVSEFTSLLGCLELERVKSRIEKRRKLAAIYAKELKNTNYQVFYDENISFYKMIIKTPKAEDFYFDYCKKHDITLTGGVYKIPVHQQPLYANKFDYKGFPKTNHFAKHHICPPLYPELTRKQVLYVCDVLKKAELYERS